MSEIAEIPLSSEYAGIINFVVAELVIMAYVMYASSVIAGALNYIRISKGSKLDLKVFDLPHIGGGLVMNGSRARLVLIGIRLMTLVAIAVSNFGLEGRTALMTEVREASIRSPGPLAENNTRALFNATERQMRCASTVDDELVFGAVIDGICYPTVTDDVYIRGISLNFTTFNMSGLGCSVEKVEFFFLTIYKCDGVDISCLGLFDAGDVVERGRCESVIYDGEGSWLCPVESVRPGVDEPVLCRRIRARREDISGWTEVFRFFTPDLETAVFGAAYGREERKEISVPTEERNITVVTLFWLIPAVIQVIMVWIVTVWVIVLRRRGAMSIAHDEAGLTSLLKSRGDVTAIGREEWIYGTRGGIETPATADDTV